MWDKIVLPIGWLKSKRFAGSNLVRNLGDIEGEMGRVRERSALGPRLIPTLDLLFVGDRDYLYRWPHLLASLSCWASFCLSHFKRNSASFISVPRTTWFILYLQLEKRKSWPGLLKLIVMSQKKYREGLVTSYVSLLYQTFLGQLVPILGCNSEISLLFLLWQFGNYWR